MPSETTQESRDSIAAKMAIVKALGNTALTVSRFHCGKEKLGSWREIVYRSPMVLTSRGNSFTIRTPTTTAMREPGTLLTYFSLGQIIKMASPINPTSSACQLKVVMDFAIAITFSVVSTA